jgi:hypothetical protein
MSPDGIGRLKPTNEKCSSSKEFVIHTNRNFMINLGARTVYSKEVAAFRHEGFGGQSPLPSEAFFSPLRCHEPHHSF